MAGVLNIAASGLQPHDDASLAGLSREVGSSSQSGWVYAVSDIMDGSILVI